jgi:hypothetical protein
MGVQVNETRSDNPPIGIDGARRGLINIADDDDATIAHAHISAETRCAGSVDDDSTSDEQIEHVIPLSLVGHRDASIGDRFEDSRISEAGLLTSGTLSTRS